MFCPDLAAFIPWKEKSILFAWMVVPMLVIVVIFLSFKASDYVHDIRIYNIVTTPLFGVIVIWLMYTIMRTPSQKKEQDNYYSKPIAWVLRMTLWGSLAGRMAMMTFKVFCYATHDCHHPLVASDNLWELIGAMLDDLTDIMVLLALYLYVRHTLKSDFLDDSYKFVFQKHLILAVLILLFFQIAAQEVHELIEENHSISELEEHDELEKEASMASNRIELAIEFVAPFTFLLSTELIGLLFGLAFVMKSPKSERGPLSPEATPKRSIVNLRRFSFPVPPRFSPKPETTEDTSGVELVDRDGGGGIDNPAHEIDGTDTESESQDSTEETMKDQSESTEENNTSVPMRKMAQDGNKTPDFIPDSDPVTRPSQEPRLSRVSFQEEEVEIVLHKASDGSTVSKRSTRPDNINIPAVEEGANLGHSSPKSAVWRGFPFKQPSISFIQQTPKYSHSGRNFLAKVTIFFAVVLAVAEMFEMCQKTFLYGRFEEMEVTIVTNDSHGNGTHKTTYMGIDREVSDCLNIATNIWAAILFLLMIHKVPDDLKQGDYEAKKEESHSKIDKLFLFFTAILWTVAIGIHMAAQFVPATSSNPHHSYGLTNTQRWTGFAANLTLLIEIWLQLILLAIQLSIKLPKKFNRQSRLHHWTLIVVLHSTLTFDMVEWFTFFFDQQFTKNLLPFYPSSLLIPTRLLTPYIGMYLFHACCCWMIVRNNFRKRQYFEFGGPEMVERAIAGALSVTANVASIHPR